MSDREEDKWLAELKGCDSVVPRPELSDAIVQRCTRGLKPSRSLGAGARVALSVLAAGLSVGAFVWLTPAASRLARTETTTELRGASMWVVATAVLIFVGLGRTARSRPSVSVRRAAAVAAPASFCALLLIGAREWPSLGEFVGATEGCARAGRCAFTALLVGIWVAGAIMLIWRRTDPFTPHLSGWLIGLAGGVMGAVAVGFVCRSGEGWHLLGHAGVVGAVGLAGWILGRRILAP